VFVLCCELTPCRAAFASPRSEDFSGGIERKQLVGRVKPLVCVISSESSFSCLFFENKKNKKKKKKKIYVSV
jgi:hypothetical protein